MSQSPSRDALLHAFKAIGADGRDSTPIHLASLYAAVSETADRMRAADQPVERVIADVKALASEAGLRVSHNRLVTSAVLWAIDSYFRTGMEFAQPLDVAQFAARLHTLVNTDEAPDVQPRLSGRSERLPIARESRWAKPSMHVSP